MDNKRKKSFIKSILPPPEWRLPVIILMGALTGLSLFALIESKATSYLSDDPATCVNCHVMTPQYVTWKNSSHRKWASCNDCHVPQDNFLKKYAFKASDGLYHSYVFTTRGEPEVIKMRESSKDVVQNNCIRCHKNQVTDVRLSGLVSNHLDSRTTRKCWDCHQEVPHGSVRSLSAIKYYGKIQQEGHQNIPNWIKEAVQNSNKSNKNK